MHSAISGKKVLIYLIRHGETTFNVAGYDIIGGRSPEIQLTSKGIIQAIDLGKYLKEKVFFDQVYCSTAERAIWTAKYCLKGMEVDLPIIQNENLLEQCQGDWEKKSRSTIYQRPDVKANLIYNNWKFIPGDDKKGESQKQCGMRMYNQIMKIIADANNTEVNIAIFTHGLSIKYLLAIIFKNDPKFKRYSYELLQQLQPGDKLDEDNPKISDAHHQPIDNTSITQIIYQFGNFSLLSCNSTPHFSKQ